MRKFIISRNRALTITAYVFLVISVGVLIYAPFIKTNLAILLYIMGGTLLVVALISIVIFYVEKKNISKIADEAEQFRNKNDDSALEAMKQSQITDCRLPRPSRDSLAIVDVT